MTLKESNNAAVDGSIAYDPATRRLTSTAFLDAQGLRDLHRQRLGGHGCDWQHDGPGQLELHDRGCTPPTPHRRP